MNYEFHRMGSIVNAHPLIENSDWVTCLNGVYQEDSHSGPKTCDAIHNS
jgi:hypothetical protein